MTSKLKVRSAKRKVKTQNFPVKSGSRPLLCNWREKFLVLSFSFTLFALHFAFIVPFVFAQSISSSELINNTKQYDGKLIVYKGEVIGDIMVRGGYAWINVNDEKNAIGIWIKKELIKDIIYTGSYKAKGDLVEIAGKFNRSCAEHGGDLDIHAQCITKLSSGSKISRTINTKAIKFALALFCIIVLVFLLKMRQSRNSVSARLS